MRSRTEPIGGLTGCGSRRRNALQLLDTQHADTVQHLNGSLLDHLKRTERRLRDWGTTDELALAGLCHACYGTDGFAPALLRLEQRDVLATTVGPGVEAAVYFYASADRDFLYAQLGSVAEPSFRDRFTHAVHTPTEEVLRAFVDLTLANEADVAQLGAATTKVPDWFAALVEQFGPVASRPVAEACRQLVDRTYDGHSDGCGDRQEGRGGQARRNGVMRYSATPSEGTLAVSPPVDDVAPVCPVQTFWTS